ncbi:FAD-dependent oxidoreductase [Cellulomonas sp. DKR-3]|uniref:FAD-dependent oxidoreductase n=1 Tax=Cellulomonas fulva TaxID=2835530 RepID=A0ABS5U2X4_9CELL|nr:FAD-binding oxidoreductase [Cellulomonas fulva]MBT0995734.1 FAD-dependent oxidoreductase [Cellulomonas fulva]
MTPDAWDPADPAPWADESVGAQAPLDGDTTADVVVVGAGLTGLWAAYYLLDADPSLDVLLVDRGLTGQDERGLGACSSRVGLAPDALARRFGDAAARDARALLRDAVVEVGGVVAVEEIDCGFAFGGELLVAADDVALGRMLAAAHDAAAWGDEVHALDAAGVRERFGSDDVRGGSWSPDAARLSPGRLARGLRDVVLARGGRSVDHTPVVQAGAGAVLTTHGTVRAGIVVDTRPGGAPAEQAATIATAPLPAATWAAIGLERAELVAHSDGLRLVRTPDDRLVAGRARSGGSRAARLLDALSRRRASAPALHEALVDLLPALGEAPVTHAWRRPLAHPGALPQVTVLEEAPWRVARARSGGTGPAAANVAGRAVAELLTGSSSEWTAAPWVTHA